MRLSDFLHIPKAVIEANPALVALIDCYEYFYTPEVKKSLILAIKRRYSPDLFIKLALRNSIIDDLCKSSELLSYWEDSWLAFQTDHSLKFQPLPTIHCFDLIKGSYLYRQYTVERRSNSEHAADYLLASANLGCFSAINALCHNRLKSTDTRLTSDEISELMFLCQKAAEVHWTPGYLLLANVCIEIAALVKDEWSERFTVSPSAEYYRKALEALYFAEYFQHSSEAAIHNIYHEKSLAEVYKDTHLADISQARALVMALCPSLNKIQEAIRELTRTKFLKIANDYKLLATEDTASYSASLS